jgi:hypothetical protein
VGQMERGHRRYRWGNPQVSVALPLLAGILLASVLVGAAHGRPPGAARRLYAVGLVVAALTYVAFAAAGGAGAPWLAAEVAGVALFGGAAWVGLRGSPVVLAVGWAVHVAWDVLLHLEGAGATYTPSWYPWLCASFDLVVAGAVLVSVRRRVSSASRPAT